jgi:hypothetical protein
MLDLARLSVTVLLWEPSAEGRMALIDRPYPRVTRCVVILECISNIASDLRRLWYLASSS